MPIDSSDYKINIKTNAETGSVRETREQFHLLRLAIGETLGPIGELIHFLSNPYLLAAAGVTLAIKMLVEQHQALFENLKKNLELTEAQTRLFLNAHLEAIRTVTAEIAKMNDERKHSRDAIDLESEALARQIAMQQSVLQTMNESGDAALKLYEARVKLDEQENKLTGPAANAAITAMREQIQARKDEAAYTEKLAEATEHAKRASDAFITSSEESQLTNADGELQAKKQDLTELLNGARALTTVRQTAAEAAEKALIDAKVRAADLGWELDGNGGIRSGPAMWQKQGRDSESAEAALKANLDLISAKQSELDAINADIKSHVDRAKQQEDVYVAESKLQKETELAAETLKTRNAINARANHDLEQVNRRAALEGNANRTPDEEAELAGMTSNLSNRRNPATGQITRGLIEQAGRVVRRLVNDRNTTIGPLNAEDHQEIATLLSTLIGMQHNSQADIGNFREMINQLTQEVAWLKSRQDGNTNRP